MLGNNGPLGRLESIEEMGNVDVRVTYLIFDSQDETELDAHLAGQDSVQDVEGVYRKRYRRWTLSTFIDRRPRVV